jgi:hypothetical protein
LDLLVEAAEIFVVVVILSAVVVLLFVFVTDLVSEIIKGSCLPLSYSKTETLGSFGTNGI